MSWKDWILGNELSVRLSFFFGVFAAMTLWEILSPRRKLSVSKGLRWTNNLGLFFLNSLILRLLFPTATVGVAVLAEQQGWGLLHYYELPYALPIVIAVVTMDFVIYLQHVMVHAIPLLWRLHRVHHADLDYDVTTGARFHTIEIILSMLIKFATIMVLGPPVVAVVIFEVLLNATAMFNHCNIYIPEKIDRVLRLFVVTPDMHRVHHSVHAPLTNSNFGFNLPWWDRLFGTYVAQPPEGHIEMEIGLHDFRDPKQVDRLPGMLMLPFVRQLGEYTINRRW
ncbi:MAG: sterol desaturase family protein [Candidatus Thiodiazotropha sp. (ex Lucinoma aequizonata)]|nr:sterol desaturase family protein [Candidatus Thiodiazotropha sp. (ex Lucinoma aequizonata)]MCU7888945.1 sterol desaturase family protein [Candidatus Thiodiazotropha sp. (ex Lucinoma aequizonata)]MCU7896322.1 sterol desaturase family protein [Candidatus Thiodiazotropha sp. (ex Lucinoma aequizonata)]MCU7898600.1 sterol desaturase family protein [Candidatus Thiodiazotropha sp. (ex Lucinoma aequizonata)]MCU7903054.1 sterol desaturase family protein [Candidatus Thiodiazotropha sp. (ex Lucinoma ae